MVRKRWGAAGFAVAMSLSWLIVAAAEHSAEYNPSVARHPSLGPEAGRLIVGFRAGAGHEVVRSFRRPGLAQSVVVREASTRTGDALELAQRAHLNVVYARQLTPGMHVMFLATTLHGAEVESALQALRADPAVLFADVDQRRYPHAVPDDPLFLPSAGAAGQWFMQSPGMAPAGDAAATDAVSAWAITTGSSGTVIADIDTGVRFEHPDLLRAGFGGRLLPGYDFVGGDRSATNGAPLETFLIANDGDGWDPDPSDPGDWINSADRTNALFPAAQCAVADSTWHGTRVMGLLGALTNNGVGIAGMTWKPHLLPVRALGKCGGYDSDIITAMRWAVGMSVSGVPDNPYPADIINLSLGGSGSCPSSYSSVIATLNAMGVLIVASAGNASGPVDSPANCSGVLGVAGLRNVGTKVGYSSLGPEVGIAAPAGNCVNASGACLKSIDTTGNSGLTAPADSIYTNETNPNLGTSFSAPIVSGIAALMRAVNANLTPAQLIARIEASATPFPQPLGLPVCPSADPNSGECACPLNGTQCGAGMVNAFAAVSAALRPIAALALPAAAGGSSNAVLDATGSAASCGRTVASYAWTVTGGVQIVSGAHSAQVTVMPQGSAGTVTLTVTDSQGATDVATVAVSAAGALSMAATTLSAAGTAAGACPGDLAVTPAAPTVTQSFAPASVGMNVVSTLTLTLNNTNGYALTQANFTETLPANLELASASSAAANLAPATTCTGNGTVFATTATTAMLKGASIPANGSCSITLPVQAATPGSYLNTVAANALTTGPAGANAEAVSATLNVTTPTGGGGGGGAWDGWDSLLVVGILLAGRRHTRRRPPGG